MMFTQPINFPENFSIKSGLVDLIQAVGITPSELEIAKETSSKRFEKKLLVKLEAW